MTTQNQNDAGSTDAAPALSATLTVNSVGFVHACCAAFGATAVIAAFFLLKHLAGIFAGILPYVGGAVLFAAIVSTFFMLLAMRKNMRSKARLRLSFSEAYAAVSIFIAMGFFATGCLHAFLADGQAVALWTNGVTAAALWTNGVTAAALSATGFGLGKFGAALWQEGKKNS